MASSICRCLSPGRETSRNVSPPVSSSQMFSTSPFPLYPYRHISKEKGLATVDLTGLAPPTEKNCRRHHNIQMSKNPIYSPAELSFKKTEEGNENVSSDSEGRFYGRSTGGTPLVSSDEETGSTAKNRQRVPNIASLCRTCFVQGNPVGILGSVDPSTPLKQNENAPSCRHQQLSGIQRDEGREKLKGNLAGAMDPETFSYNQEYKQGTATAPRQKASGEASSTSYARPEKRPNTPNSTAQRGGQCGQRDNPPGPPGPSGPPGSPGPALGQPHRPDHPTPYVCRVCRVYLASHNHFFGEINEKVGGTSNISAHLVDITVNCYKSSDLLDDVPLSTGRGVVTTQLVLLRCSCCHSAVGFRVYRVGLNTVDYPLFHL